MMNIEKDKFYKATQKQFTFWSKWYDSRFMRLLYFEKLYEKIISVITGGNEYLKAGGKFLDVACGTGEIIYRLAKKHPDVNFTGVDFNGEMIRIAQEKTKHSGNIQIINSDAISLPFEDKMFDFVLCSDALHHFSEPELSTKEIGRVTKDGGLFLLVDPAANARFQKIMINFFGRLLELVNKYYSRENIEKMIQPYGFVAKNTFVYKGNNFVLSKKQFK